MITFENVIKNVCGEYLAPTDYEIYNGTLFYTAPAVVSSKIVAKLSKEFDSRIMVSKFEMDYWAVDFVE